METHHWRIYPPHFCTAGCFSLRLLIILHRTRLPYIGVLLVQQAPSQPGNLHQEGCQFKIKTRRKKKAFMASFNCQMSSSHKDKKNTSTFSDTNTHTQKHFLTLWICVHTSVRSHHITYGEEILLFVCGLFCAFPPLDCPLVLLHLRARTLDLHTHTSTLDLHRFPWAGHPNNPLTPSLKS